MNKYIKSISDKPDFETENYFRGYNLSDGKLGIEVDFIDMISGHKYFQKESQSIHIYYILEGKGIACIDNNKYEIKKGDTVEIPVGIEYAFKGRMKMIEGLIFVFFTIWGIDSLLKIKEKINPLYYFLCVFIYCLIYILNINSNQLSYMPKYIYLLEILYFAVILTSLYIRYEELSLALLLGLLIFASISINPIERGIFAIENHPSAREIKRIIKEDSDSYWIGYNSLVLQGYALANGAKTLNAVNYYPDFKKWYKLDINKANEEAYNRYAHIVVTLSETNETIFEKETSADVVRVKIPLNKFKDLNVKYILTQEKLTQETNQYKLEEIYKDSNCFIYEIKEKELKKSKIKKND